MDIIERKLLKQLLRTLERIERRGIEPFEKHPDPDSKAAVTDKDSNEVPPPLRVIAETNFPSELKKQYGAGQQKSHRLQKWNLAVQAFLCLFTAGAFAAAFYYAQVANKTLLEMRKQNSGMLHALIVRDGQPVIQIGDTLKISYLNTGHSVAKLLWVWGTYEEDVNGEYVKQTETPTQYSPKDRDVSPGFPYIAFVNIPATPTTKDDWRVMVRISLTYDDGFGNNETVNSCCYLRRGSSIWSENCWLGDSIDLSRHSE